MTKEKLKEEAIKYAVDYPTSYGKGYKHKDLRIVHLAGAEPREKRIADLERKLEQTEKDLIDYQFNYPKIKDLEKENALLKGRNKGFEQQVMGLLIKYEEVYKRFPDLKSAMDKAQTILKENAELKEINTHTLSQLNLDNGELIIENEQLRKENAELKEKVDKATELIGDMYDKDVLERAEQFLKE